jgi:hypothetical protein
MIQQPYDLSSDGFVVGDDEVDAERAAEIARKAQEKKIKSAKAPAC